MRGLWSHMMLHHLLRLSDIHLQYEFACIVKERIVREENVEKKRMMWMNNEKEQGRKERGKRRIKVRMQKTVKEDELKMGEWEVEMERKVVEIASSGGVVPTLGYCLLSSIIEGQEWCWLLWNGTAAGSCVWCIGTRDISWSCHSFFLGITIQHFVFLLDPSLWARSGGNKCLPFQLYALAKPNVGLCETSHVFREGRPEGTALLGLKGTQASLVAVFPGGLRITALP